MTMGTAGHPNQNPDGLQVCLSPLVRTYVTKQTGRDADYSPTFSGWWVLRCAACGYEEKAS